MPRVLPSQVVAAIPDLFPGVARRGNQATLGANWASRLRTLLSLVNMIPDEFIVMDSDTYLKMMLAISSIENAFDYWNRNQARATVELIGAEQDCSIWVISDALSLCKDEAAPANTTELQFIADSKTRETFRSDIGAAERALSNGEWKAATILAGAMIEALLHWKLREPQTARLDLEKASAAAVNSGALDKQPAKDPNEWNLYQYNAVAVELQVIKPTTEKQIKIAKDYRNLIHPGVATRTAQVCDRATAHAAMSGLYHVIRDLAP